MYITDYILAIEVNIFKRPLVILQLDDQTRLFVFFMNTKG